MTLPTPVNLWVLIDESPDSINDAAFAVDNQYTGASTRWQDGSGNLSQRRLRLCLRRRTFRDSQMEG